MNINNLLSNKKKFYTTKELRNLSISHYLTHKLIAEGKLSKLNTSLYVNNSYLGDDSDFAYASAIVPNGVICLISAAIYYNLTTTRPNEINIAIERTHKISKLPDWPPINIIYFSQKRFETGITTITNSNQKIHVYDIEKTVIDIIFYRNKIGIEETKEILKNYLASPKRNLNKLFRYANLLNCKNIINTYLEVLL